MNSNIAVFPDTKLQNEMGHHNIIGQQTVIMGFQSTQWIKNQGFNGFKTIAELRASKLTGVPKSPGVYLILKNHITKPEFLAKSPDGWFKGKDPSIDPVELRMRWISHSLG